MDITTIQGNINYNKFFIYTAADAGYFDEFGKILINSIDKNSNIGVHMHLYNPREDQLEYCRTRNISFTYEQIPLNLFENAAKKWEQELTSKFDIERKKRIDKSMQKGGDTSIIERMQKTYFACARFIRLAEILQSSQKVFAIDVDAIVRKDITLLPDGPDLYIHKNSQFLAGGIYLNGTNASVTFLNQYATLLRESLKNDLIYWSLDQDILDQLVPTTKFAELPRSYIDWNMLPDSYIWTAKGKRKDLEIFKNEKLKYKD